MGPKELTLGLEKRLKLYQADRPYRRAQPGEGNN